MTLRSRRVRVGSWRCAVAAATPLAALTGTRLPFELRDYGSYGRSTGDAGVLFVRRIGPDRNRGRDGWVYKVGRPAGTTGAGDPTGPFGTGCRLREGRRVLWFWCVMSRERRSIDRSWRSGCRRPSQGSSAAHRHGDPFRSRPTAPGDRIPASRRRERRWIEAEADSCQRTLEVRPAATRVPAGATPRVTVRGYDDRGRGVPVGGATVQLGDAVATTGADGVAGLVAPAAAGRLELTAERPGLVPAFPRGVTVR